MTKCVLLAVSSIAVVGSVVNAANLAADDASNYSSWTNGSNGGVGFGPWQLMEIGNNNINAFAGHFLANGAGDLNFVGTGPGPRAWGLYANDNSADNSNLDSLESAAAFRSFTGGGLSVGQSFVVRMEHGSIDDVGSFNPVNVPNVGNVGWVGIVFDPFPSNGANPITPFTNPSGLPAFGFSGGDSTYRIYDSLTPSGRSFGTGVPFTTVGLEITFAATSASTTTISVRNLATTVVVSEVINNGITTAQRFGLYNRNSEQADVFFNSLQVIPEPATLSVLAGVAMLALRRRRV